MAKKIIVLMILLGSGLLGIGGFKREFKKRS
jgi:hypothetical protein